MTLNKKPLIAALMLIFSASGLANTRPVGASPARLGPPTAGATLIIPQETRELNALYHRAA